MMGDRGPQPEDPDILKLRGSRAAEKREIPVSEDSPPPKMPTKLGKHAKRKWKEMAADLQRRGFFDSTYASSLELLCLAYERMVTADEAIGKSTSKWTSTTDKGYPVLDPLFAVRNQAEATYLKLLDMFGCSPGTRLKAKSGKPGRKSGVSSRDRGHGMAS